MTSLSPDLMSVCDLAGHFSRTKSCGMSHIQLNERVYGPPWFSFWPCWQRSKLARKERRGSKRRGSTAIRVHNPF
ncbi:hypothetical protein PG987_009192 [Apiospora arundinis]